MAIRGRKGKDYEYFGTLFFSLLLRSYFIKWCEEDSSASPVKLPIALKKNSLVKLSR
jgi:hypothetical protein